MMDSRILQPVSRLSAFTLVLFLNSYAIAGTTINRPVENEAAAPEESDALVVLVDDAISRTRRRFLDANQHTPWQILHGLLALRGEFELIRNGQRVNAIEYVSNAARYGGDYWFEATVYGGRAHPFTVPYAFEGHVNQSLALLSMSNLPADHEFHVRGGRVVTMGDMIRNAQMTVNTNEETTWTLWFLTHYVDQDEEWMNQNHEPWSMERLVDIQVRSEVTRAPCGGSHQLFALAFARNAKLKQSGHLEGAWTDADQKLRRYTASARSLQNSDGSFSTIYFKGRKFSYEFNERIKSSGHTLEWLMMALPDSDLDETWVRRGIESVSRDLINNANQPADCGPLYHALHSLVLYKQRVAPPETPYASPATELVETDTHPEVPMPVEVPEPPITIESEGVATTQTVARPPHPDLPLVNLDGETEPAQETPAEAGEDTPAETTEETSMTTSTLPPPPPVTLRYEPEDEPEEVASSGDTADNAEPVPDSTDNELPPLPPRRPVRSADTESESVIR